MPAVSGGVVGRDGKRHPDSPCLLPESPGLKAGEKISSRALAAEGKAVKGEPGNAGDDVTVLRRRALRGQQAAARWIPSGILQIDLVKLPEGFPIFRPEQSRGAIPLAEPRISRHQSIPIAHGILPFRRPQSGLVTDGPGHKPQIGWEELPPRCPQSPSGLRHIQ